MAGALSVLSRRLSSENYFVFGNNLLYNRRIVFYSEIRKKKPVALLSSVMFFRACSICRQTAVTSADVLDCSSHPAVAPEVLDEAG